MGVEVKDTDKGFAVLLARVAGAKSFSLTIGIHEAEGARAYEPPVREKVNEKAKSKGAKGKKTKAEEKPKKESDMTLAELGEIHEFGLGVPQRSFLGDWVDETEKEKNDQLRGVARALVAGEIESIEDGFEQLGNLYVAQVQKRIADNIPPPLSPLTIKMKGSSVPLIDTGQLRSAITYKVKTTGKKGGKKR